MAGETVEGSESIVVAEPREPAGINDEGIGRGTPSAFPGGTAGAGDWADAPLDRPQMASHAVARSRYQGLRSFMTILVRCQSVLDPDGQKYPPKSLRSVFAETNSLIAVSGRPNLIPLPPSAPGPNCTISSRALSIVAGSILEPEEDPRRTRNRHRPGTVQAELVPGMDLRGERVIFLGQDVEDIILPRLPLLGTREDRVVVRVIGQADEERAARVPKVWAVPFLTATSSTL